MRRNPITGERVLFAPSRESRPHAWGDPERAGERCPFCPGHEADTPPAIAACGDPWRIRVFANKYPASAGAEVIVESPRHEDRFEDLAHAAEVVEMFASRLAAHRTAACAALFRNEGQRAGASLAHIHSQIVPLPFLPPRIERELAAFRAAPCPLCRSFECAVVAEDENFRWVVPAAAALPYQQWIVPRRHVASLTALAGDEIPSLAQMLQRASRSTRALAGSFNWMFMNFPDAAGHFYVDVLPRKAGIAGLELGTGAFVEIIDPALAASRLAD